MKPARLSAAAALVFLLLTGAIALHTPPAHAAVNECHSEMSSRTVKHETEIEAKKQALADWIKKAGEIGPGYTRWQLAYNRRIDCSKSAGSFSCQAIARPCMIKQVPSQDNVPLKRGVP